MLPQTQSIAIFDRPGSLAAAIVDDEVFFLDLHVVHRLQHLGIGHLVLGTGFLDNPPWTLLCHSALIVRCLLSADVPNQVDVKLEAAILPGNLSLTSCWWLSIILHAPLKISANGGELPWGSGIYHQVFTA